MTSIGNARIGDFELHVVCKNMLAGGVAGMCAKSVVAPLDRIKILLQVHNVSYSNEGVISGLRKIVVQESVQALYKGNGAQMIRIFPYAATQFTSYEFYKHSLLKLTHNTSIGKFLVSGVAGSMAGVTAVTLTFPLDLVRARLAFQISGSHVYKGVFHALVTIFRFEGGLKALYKGLSATVCGMIPYAGASFYSFERLKHACMKYLPEYTCQPCEKNTGGLVLDIYAKLLCGGVSGLVAQTFSYPFDVARRRMQLSGMSPEMNKFGSSMIKTLLLTYKDHGIVRGLYRGLSINYIRALPMTAVSFSTYELMKQYLGLDTGISIKVG